MKVYIFLFLFVFIILNRILFNKIKVDLHKYTKLKGVNGPIIETLIGEKELEKKKKTTLFKKLIEQLKVINLLKSNTDSN